MHVLSKLIILLILILLPNMLFAEPSWKPLTSITEEEIAIIECAAKKPIAHILAGAQTFTTIDSIVVLRYPAEDRVFICDSLPPHHVLPMTAEAREPLSKGEYVRELTNRFTEIWSSYTSANEMSQKQLTEADEIMEELLNGFAEDPDRNRERGDVLYIAARRGNRYFPWLEPLFPHLNAGERLEFYENYIHEGFLAYRGDYSYIRIQDIPDENSLTIAIHKFHNLLHSQDLKMWRDPIIVAAFEQFAPYLLETTGKYKMY